MLSFWYILILNIHATKFTQCVNLKTINPIREDLRILGGHDALSGEYSYVLRIEVEVIRKNSTVNKCLCTCACIKPTWSLTAAHCIRTMKSLILGGKKLVLRYKPSPTEVAFVKILSMFMNPNYYSSYRRYFVRNDIGILKTENIALSSYARVSAVDYSTLYGLKVYAVGYGLMLDDHGSFNDTLSLNKPLQVVDAMIIKCDSNFKPEFCLAGACEKKTFLAAGDSGGPVIHSSGIVGVISGGRYNVEWAQDIGSITPVSPFMDWIVKVINLNLSCGHVFHLHCCKKVLANKWVGPRITFSFSQCPICKENMNHWTLEDLLTPIRNLRDEVKRKALMRLEYEGMAAGGSHSRAQADPATYAMERYAYYVCHKCGKAYFGGLARCEAESSGWWEPSELVCGACSDVAGARTCPKHGADFLEYKCRYCCSVAVFFCFGTSHFCNSCHDDFQRVTNIPRHLLPQCPAGPKGEQLPGTAEECPLHVQHPPTGEEFALGCGVCRHAHAF